MYQLKANLLSRNDEALKNQLRIWNFVRNDIDRLLSWSNFIANVAVVKTDKYGFKVSYQESGKVNELLIDSTLQFAHNLTIESSKNELPVLILAVLMRLQKTYKQAFEVICNHYQIVKEARGLLDTCLGLSVTNNWISEFIDCPMPGRKPNKNKALTSREIVQRSENKKRASGMVRLSSWLDGDVRKMLDEYCVLHGKTLEESLAEIIPSGIKIRAYINSEVAKLSNKAD